jgi:hypothetical protein
VDERRALTAERRAHARGGRRAFDQPKPWYLRRRLWLAVASIGFVAWKRVKRVGRPRSEAAA